ncbi:MAG: hypothetical protein H6622_06515 [Halobacteriovoraceae bacterium]|nr:hypothetical protein [Halobacteriovoraceae bacterium]
MKTDFETLKALASFTLNHLKEDEVVDFNPATRLDLIEALATEFGVSFATEEDIREQAIEEVEDKMGADNLPEDITESEMYNHARKEIIKSFNGENISGLYLVESLHQVANRAKEFLLSSELIEDVFGTDEEVVAYLVKHIRNFSLRRG